MSEAVRTRALTPFGVEVDLDLAGPVGDDVRAELVERYDRHHLLVFRGQRLDDGRHLEVAGWFGPVLRSEGGGTGVGYVSTDPATGGLGTGRLAFHSDLACSPAPFLGLTLFAVDVDDGATGTAFADAVAALAALPDGLRRRIERLEACHLWPTTLSDRQRRAEVGPDWPGSVHPIVLRHPRTGVEVLFVNEHQTDAVVGLPADEGEALLQELFGVLYRPANVFEHRWAAGDLLVWDNIALQHARHDLTGAGTRTLRRVALATRDVSDLMPDGLLEAYQAAGA